jgi:hypothetical protein
MKKDVSIGLLKAFMGKRQHGREHLAWLFLAQFAP